jgi:2Fe-2S ferredoxin
MVFTLKKIKTKTVKNMAKLNFIRKDGSVIQADAADGLSVMEVAQQYKIPEIEGSCGGGLSCATCHVYVRPDWYPKTLPDDGISLDEEDMLDLAFDVRTTSRLCCQIIMDADKDGLEVAVPSSSPDWEGA